MITLNKKYSRADLAIELENLFRKHRSKFTDFGKFFLFRPSEIVARLNLSLPNDNRLSVLVDAAGRTVASLYFSDLKYGDVIILDRKLFSFDDVRRFALQVESILSGMKELRRKDYFEEL